VFLIRALVLVAMVALPAAAQPRPGVEPKDTWTCPVSHPIKGNFRTYSGERCIFHMRGGKFYEKTKPERCYAIEGYIQSSQGHGGRRASGPLG